VVENPCGRRLGEGLPSPCAEAMEDRERAHQSLPRARERPVEPG